MAGSEGRKGEVRVVRGAALDAKVRDPAGNRRATVFDFAGTGAGRTHIGRASIQPGAKTGAHHHGGHELVIHVISGRVEIRWGDRLDYAAEVEPGDSVYFSPFVPHQERNLSDTQTVELLVVRSDVERIAVALQAEPVEKPELVADS